MSDLELEFQVALSHQKWEVGTKSRSYERAALNQWAISPVPWDSSLHIVFDSILRMKGNCAPRWTYKQPHLPSTTHVAQTDNGLIHGSREGHPIKLSWWMKPVGAHGNVIIILGIRSKNLLDTPDWGKDATPSLGPHTLVNTLHYDSSSPTNLPSYILCVSQANRQRIPNCP